MSVVDETKRKNFEMSSCLNTGIVYGMQVFRIRFPQPAQSAVASEIVLLTGYLQPFVFKQNLR